MAEGVELGTAYVSIIPEVSKVGTIIKDALMGAGVHADAAGKDIGERLGVSLTGALTNPISSAKTALENLGSAGGDGAFGMAAPALAAAGAVGGIAVAAGTVGKALYDMGQQWADITDNIILHTNLSGDAVNALSDRISHVADSTAAPISKIGDIEVALQRVHDMAADQQDKLAQQIANYDQMTKDPLNVNAFINAMREFDVPVSQYGEKLDELYGVSKTAHEPLSKIVDDIATSGASAAAAGLNIDQFAGFMSALDEAGVNVEKSMNAVGRALKNVSQDSPALKKLITFEPGEDPVQRLEDVIKKIQELHQAGDDLDAIALGGAAFGKAWGDVSDAIIHAKLNADDLKNSLESGGQSIAKDRQDTKHWGDDFQILKNQIEDALKPLSEDVFKFLDEGLMKFEERIFDVFGQIGGYFRNFFNTSEPGIPFTGQPGVPYFPPGGGSPPVPGVGPAPPGSYTPGAGPPITAPSVGPVNPFGSAGTGSTPGQNPLDVINPRALIPSAGGNALPPSAAPSGLSGTQGAVYDAMISAGFSPDQWGALSQIVTHESGWNPTARNPSSGAFGLGQFLGHEGDKYGAMGAYSGQPGPEANAMMSYIKDRYGTPSNAWAFWQGHNWYDDGGLLQPGVTAAHNNTGQPEMVLGPEVTKQLMGGGGSGGGGRKAGYIPAKAGETGTPGTSAVSGFLMLGDEFVNSAIDQAVSAASAGANIAAPGSGAGASAALSLGANAAKAGIKWGFQEAGIGIDSLMDILSPVPLPRWLSYNYTSFLPNLTAMGQPLTTAEKAQQQQQKTPPMPPGQEHLPAGATPGQPIPPGPTAPGGPVQPGQLPGQATVAPPAPFGPPHGTTPGAPPGPQQQSGFNPMSLLGFDQGGFMPPGGVGINMTQQPEPVFTDTQWQQISQMLPPESSGPNFGVHIEHLYTQDADDLKRQIDSQQRLAMMRYSGRPYS